MPERAWQVVFMPRLRLIFLIALLIGTFSFVFQHAPRSPLHRNSPENSKTTIQPAQTFPAIRTDTLQAGEKFKWLETFSSEPLDPTRWIMTCDGDFHDKRVDIACVRKRGPNDFRLRLKADTMDTVDESVKFLGIRSVEQFRFGEELRFAVELDWNEQINGCYLSAGIILSPHQTAGNVLDSADWLKVEYIGVPPGENARLAIAVNNDGHEQTLYTEGWPETNRLGRKITNQRISVVVKKHSLEVFENGRSVFDAKTDVIYFESAFLYLQISSHSNYPAREIYYDNVQIDGAEISAGIGSVEPTTNNGLNPSASSTPVLLPSK